MLTHTFSANTHTLTLSHTPMEKIWTAEKHIERARNGKCSADVRWDLEWVMHYADQCISKCFQILSSSHIVYRLLLSHLVSSGEGTEQENPFRADLTTVSSRDLNQHPLYFMHRYSAFAPELILQPKFFDFAPNRFTRQDPIWSLTLTFLFISLHYCTAYLPQALFINKSQASLSAYLPSRCHTDSEITAHSHIIAGSPIMHHSMLVL